MRIVPTEEQRDLASMLRSLFNSECPIEMVRHLREPNVDPFPAELWKSMAEAGCLGLSVPEEYGGSGGTLSDVAVWHVEAGRALAPTVLHGTIHLGLAIAALADDGQRSRHLPALCEGDLRGTVALGSPYDALDVRPRLVAVPVQGDEGEAQAWEVSGVVEHVLDADLANLILVTAAEKNYGQPGRTLGVLLDGAAQGLQVRPLSTNTGDRWQALHLDRVRVSASEVLTGPQELGLAHEDLRRMSLTMATMFALDMVGGAEAVLQQTVDYTTTRHQFGRPLAGFQAVQHIVANMHILVQTARLASHSAAFWLGSGRTAVREAAIAVMTAATAYRRTTLDAHQLHGGMGYVLETNLHLWSERSRELSVLGGGADVAARWLEEEIGL